MKYKTFRSFGEAKAFLDGEIAAGRRGYIIREHDASWEVRTWF